MAGTVHELEIEDMRQKIIGVGVEVVVECEVEDQ